MIYNDIFKNEASNNVFKNEAGNDVLNSKTEGTTYAIDDLKNAAPDKYGAVLRDFLKRLQLTQKEFAELADMGSTQIWAYCNNKKYPRGSTRKVIFSTVSDLLSEDKKNTKESELEQIYEFDDGWEMAKELACLGYGVREKIFGTGDLEKIMISTPLKTAKRIYNNYRKELVKPGVIAFYKENIKCLVTKVDGNFATIFIPETGLSKEVPVLNLKKTNEKLKI